VRESVGISSIAGLSAIRKLSRNGWPEILHRLEVARLGVLQLMKVFMHERDQPGGAGLTGCVFGFADGEDENDDEGDC
jgi:hypothetical protein